jgi:transcriptional regulator with XRE-family HTH domain
MISLKEIFVLNLKKFRKLKGISQMKLAEKCDTAVSYIGQIEMGRRFPSMELTERIAEALEVEPYRFFMEKPEICYETTENADDYLAMMPQKLRQNMIKRLNTALQTCIEEILDPSTEK